MYSEVIHRNVAAKDLKELRMAQFDIGAQVILWFGEPAKYVRKSNIEPTLCASIVFL